VRPTFSIGPHNGPRPAITQKHYSTLSARGLPMMHSRLPNDAVSSVSEPSVVTIMDGKRETPTGMSRGILEESGGGTGTYGCETSSRPHQRSGPPAPETWDATDDDRIFKKMKPLWVATAGRRAQWSRGRRQRGLSRRNRDFPGAGRVSTMNGRGVFWRTDRRLARSILASEHRLPPAASSISG